MRAHPVHCYEWMCFLSQRFLGPSWVLMQYQVHVEAWIQHQLLPAGGADRVPRHQGHSAQHHHQQE